MWFVGVPVTIPTGQPVEVGVHVAGVIGVLVRLHVVAASNPDTTAVMARPKPKLAIPRHVHCLHLYPLRERPLRSLAPVSSEGGVPVPLVVAVARRPARTTVAILRHNRVTPKNVSV